MSSVTDGHDSFEGVGGCVGSIYFLDIPQEKNSASIYSQDCTNL